MIGLLDRWRHLERINDPAAKQQFLEPLIWAVQRDPVKHEDRLVFLLIACTRSSSACRESINARSGLDLRSTGSPTDWRRREEATRLN